MRTCRTAGAAGVRTARVLHPLGSLARPRIMFGPRTCDMGPRLPFLHCGGLCAVCPRIRPTWAPFGLPGPHVVLGSCPASRARRASVRGACSPPASAHGRSRQDHCASRLDAARARLYHLDNTSSAIPIEARVDPQHEWREHALCAYERRRGAECGWECRG